MRKSRVSTDFPRSTKVQPVSEVDFREPLSQMPPSLPGPTTARLFPYFAIVAVLFALYAPAPAMALIVAMLVIGLVVVAGLVPAQTAAVVRAVAGIFRVK